jgi:hypothetical protein
MTPHYRRTFERGEGGNRLGKRCSSDDLVIVRILFDGVRICYPASFIENDA